jgi:hypothetical protein
VVHIIHAPNAQREVRLDDVVVGGHAPQERADVGDAHEVDAAFEELRGVGETS